MVNHNDLVRFADEMFPMAFTMDVEISKFEGTDWLKLNLKISPPRLWKAF